MNTEFDKENVPPFVETPVPAEEKPKSDDRSTMSLSTMIFGLAALTLALVGGGVFIFDVFQVGLFSAGSGIWAKVIPIALAYSVGWILCLMSTRSFGNLVLPLIIKYYSWVALAGVLVLYLKIMQKLFWQDYDLTHFLAYNVVLAAGLTAMLGLHLLLDEEHLRRYSIPILIVSIWHLILMVLRYVVIDGAQAIYVLGDVYFFLVMFGLAVLMLAHLGVLNPLRKWLDLFFLPPVPRNIVA